MESSLFCAPPGLCFSETATQNRRRRRQANTMKLVDRVVQVASEVKDYGHLLAEVKTENASLKETILLLSSRLDVLERIYLYVDFEKLPSATRAAVASNTLGMEEFQVFDEKVEATIFTSQVAEDIIVEPECEQSPQKHENADSMKIPPKCLHFDIHSDCEEDSLEFAHGGSWQHLASKALKQRSVDQLFVNDPWSQAGNRSLAASEDKGAEKTVEKDIFNQGGATGESGPRCHHEGLRCSGVNIKEGKADVDTGSAHGIIAGAWGRLSSQVLLRAGYHNPHRCRGNVVSRKGFCIFCDKLMLR